MTAQTRMRLGAPIVEVAGYDQGRIRRHLLRQVLQQPFHLGSAVRLAQRKVQADDVQVRVREGDVDHAVKQSPAFGAAHCNVDVPPARDGVLREQRVAMVPAGDGSILSIGVLWPDGISQNLVLGGACPGPCRDPDLLQEHKIGA